MKLIKTFDNNIITLKIESNGNKYKCIIDNLPDFINITSFYESLSEDNINIDNMIRIVYDYNSYSVALSFSYATKNMPLRKIYIKPEYGEIKFTISSNQELPLVGRSGYCKYNMCFLVSGYYVYPSENDQVILKNKGWVLYENKDVIYKGRLSIVDDDGKVVYVTSGKIEGWFKNPKLIIEYKNIKNCVNVSYARQTMYWHISAYKN